MSETINSLFNDIDNYRRTITETIRPRPIDLQVMWYAITPALENSFNKGVSWGIEYVEMMFLQNDVY